MKKIRMSEAEKMLGIHGNGTRFHLMHIEWFTKRTGYGYLHVCDLEDENPDCSHVVVDGNRHWREAGTVAALVLRCG